MDFELSVKLNRNVADDVITFIEQKSFVTIEHNTTKFRRVFTEFVSGVVFRCR